MPDNQAPDLKPPPDPGDRLPGFNSGKYNKFGFTSQQFDCLHHYLNDADLDPAKAAKAAGYSDQWAKGNAADFFESAKVKNYLERFYSKDAVQGRIWQFYFRLLQGISATKVVSRGQGSGTKMPNQVFTVPDWQTRINALAQAFKVFGEYAPTNVKVEGDLLAGKTDEEKQHIIREAEMTLRRVMGIGKAVADAVENDGEDDR